MNSNRRFGLEIEFTTSLSLSRVAELINDAGVPCTFEGYTHAVINHWKVVTDRSVSNGGELVSPPMAGQDGIEQLRKVCKVLADNGITVNSSCGLHVHMDMAGIELKGIKNILKLYAKYESEIDTIMPRSRRQSNSQWCKSMIRNTLENTFHIIDRSHTMRDLSSNLNRGDRYYKVNMESFWRYGTLEFRQHSGTVEFEKISNWVALLQNMVDRAIEANSIKLAGKTNLTKYAESAKWVRDRKAKFAAA